LPLPKKKKKVYSCRQRRFLCIPPSCCAPET
jgi:hypothetical protein